MEIKNIIKLITSKLRKNNFKIESVMDDCIFFSKDGISFTLDIEKSYIINLWIEYVNIDEYSLCYDLSNNEILYADFSNYDFVVSTGLEEVINILDDINIGNRQDKKILIMEVI